jgi:hypothetical protein
LNTAEEEDMAAHLEGFAPDEARRLRAFLPALYRRAEQAIADGQRFVHYTGAAAAMGMIRNREIWLRNTQCMNDFSEVRHGLELVRDAYRGPAGRPAPRLPRRRAPGTARNRPGALRGDRRDDPHQHLHHLPL